jgi:hypothetical protein
MLGASGFLNLAPFLSIAEMLDLTKGGFYGTLPTEVGSLTHMRYLYLNDNAFHGAIPTELGALTGLGE